MLNSEQDYFWQRSSPLLSFWTFNEEGLRKARLTRHLKKFWFLEGSSITVRKDNNTWKEKNKPQTLQNHTEGMRRYASTLSSQQGLVFWCLTTFLEPWVSRGSWPRAGEGSTGWMAVFPLHQDLGSCVRQAQPHEPSTHQHGGGQQDGDSFGDAD